MPIKRKPGELVEVDWIGSTLPVTNCSTGNNEKAHLFVASLPFSHYFYVEAFMDMKINSWITGHIHAFKYFGGVPETIVSDNLKTGVTKADRYEPILNAAYQQMADHYQTVIVPARVRKPKDKPVAEGIAGFVSRYIIAALRNYQCFSVRDLNKRIHELMEEMNQMPFQKRVGSRRSVFETEELPYLHSLPLKPFRMAEWRVSKVQRNYHVQIDKNYYSVPFEYVQDDVDVKLTEDFVEIYFKELRIASHKRLTGLVGQYSTETCHMPEAHRDYLEDSPDKCFEWAKSVGPQALRLTQKIFESTSEKQALRSVQVLRKALKKYSEEELETACEVAADVAVNPNGRLVNAILSRNKQPDEIETKIDKKKDYGFTRGPDYYGGDSSYE